MSYFDKYLKYKNKYLALKDTVGGAKKKIYELGEEEFKILFDQGIKKPLNEKCLLYKKYPHIMEDFTEYCWISPPADDKGFDYGIGLFIFKKIKGSYFSGYEDYGWSKGVESYAYWQIELHNIGPIIKLEDKSNDTITPFKTSIILKSVEGEDIPIDTSYGWNHDLNCWIYNKNNNNNKTFYKADLKLDFDYCDIIGIWNNTKNVIFDVTYEELTPYFSNYCFVGQITDHWSKGFGIGFFLYKRKKESGWPGNKYKFFNSHVNGNAEYAILYITQDNIDTITEKNITADQYKKSGRKFNTTIPLKLDNNNSLPVDTEYYWDHELNRWIYFNSTNKKYYSAAFKP
jgi:hypothetical protein